MSNFLKRKILYSLIFWIIVILIVETEVWIFYNPIKEYSAEPTGLIIIFTLGILAIYYFAFFIRQKGKFFKKGEKVYYTYGDVLSEAIFIQDCGEKIMIEYKNKQILVYSFYIEPIK